MFNSINFFETLISLGLYILIYNISLITLFWTIMQFTNLHNKTIYSLTKIKHNFNAVFTLTILFFSMAGVPPFVGFFTKLLILILLLNSNFIYLYFIFFSLLFFSLYFYVQNIRFLHSYSLSKTNYSFINFKRTSILYLQFSFIINFFLIFGFFFFDDFLLFVTWLFI